MKIIIAGAGEVGTHLAQKLSGEEHQETTLMDPDSELLARAQKKFDIFTQQGDPNNIDDLLACNVQSADLFVSVMPYENTNIIACTLASRIGAKNTIARIDNHRYLRDDYMQIFAQQGVNRLIYPEELAASEIAESLKNPWARSYLELINGAFVLLGVKVRHGSSLVNNHLYSIKEMGEKRFHIVAIKRGEETIIPSGQSAIEHGDIVFFTCLKKDIDFVRSLCNKQLNKVNDVVILGGSKIAMRTLQKAPRNIRFHLIEKDSKRLHEIESRIPKNVSLYEGDGRDLSLLSEIGMDKHTVFVALTENSETNILACLAAKKFQVSKTICKEENIDYIPLAEKLDIGTIINKKIIAAGYIYRALLGADTKTVKALTIAKADVAELQARMGSPITLHPVKDLDLPEGMTFGGMVRNGIPMMIEGDTQIQPYDNVVVFCTGVPMTRLSKLFSTPR